MLVWSHSWVRVWDIGTPSMWCLKQCSLCMWDLLLVSVGACWLNGFWPSLTLTRTVISAPWSIWRWDLGKTTFMTARWVILSRNVMESALFWQQYLCHLMRHCLCPRSKISAISSEGKAPENALLNPCLKARKNCHSFSWFIDKERRRVLAAKLLLRHPFVVNICASK